jgi:hypothetical protein
MNIQSGVGSLGLMQYCQVQIKHNLCQIYVAIMNLRLIGVSIFFPEPGKGSLSLADCPLPPEMGGGGGAPYSYSRYIYCLFLYSSTASFAKVVLDIFLRGMSALILLDILILHILLKSSPG